MKLPFSSLFVFSALISSLFSMFGCSGDDKPDSPVGPGENGTVVLFSADFETAISGWEGIPQQHNESTSWDWDRRYYGNPDYHVSGTVTVLDEGTIGVTSEHAYSGNKSLLFELQIGISSTIDAGGYYYDVQYCESFGGMRAYPIRKFSLLDYTDGDVASVSLMIKPISSTVSDDEHSIDFKVTVRGAHGLIEEIQLDHAFMEENLGNWTEITVDLTAYTGWENDIGIRVEMIPVGGSYCYLFQRWDSWSTPTDTFRPGDSSKCVVAIDDLILKVIPAAGG